jgi:hypothetical protein
MKSEKKKKKIKNLFIFIFFSIKTQNAKDK